jgi:phosphatidylglycerophosphatase C
MNYMSKLFLIDFDGTISNKDSFVQFTINRLSLFDLLLYWLLTIIRFPFYSKGDLKELFYLRFEGFQENKFNYLCDEFFKNVLSKSIKLSFLKYIENKSEHEIVIVSGSIKNYLISWCKKMGFKLISTELEVIDGKLTGRFSTPNCNGIEKVRRIKEKYNLSEYNEIHVFGNSKGDFPMLELGTHRYYKFFK